MSLRVTTSAGTNYLRGRNMPMGHEEPAVLEGARHWVRSHAAPNTQGTPGQDNENHFGNGAEPASISPVPLKKQQL